MKTQMDIFYDHFIGDTRLWYISRRQTITNQKRFIEYNLSNFIGYHIALVNPNICYLFDKDEQLIGRVLASNRKEPERFEEIKCLNIKDIINMIENVKYVNDKYALNL